jgi:hypothetical protein
LKGDNNHHCTKVNDYLYTKISKSELEQTVKKDVYNLALETSLHKCTSSCFTKNPTVCRFGYGNYGQGKPLNEKTTVNNSTGKIELKRNHTHINEFNPYILLAMKCNHDIKFLCNSSSQSLAVIYYLTNYITENGLSIYNAVALVLLAYQNREKYLTEKTDENYRCMNLLYKAYNSAANTTEYSGPQVASMLLHNGRDGTYYSSHETTCLYLTTFIKLLDKEIINNETENKEFTIESDDDSYVPVSSYNLANPGAVDSLYINKTDYTCRPVTLANINLYDFIENYQKIKNYKNKNSGKFECSKSKQHYEFTEAHPGQHRFYIVKKNDATVPLIIGPTFPIRYIDSANETKK